MEMMLKILSLIVGVFWIYTYFKGKSDRIREINSAYSDYVVALSNLKKNPLESDLKQLALSLGRRYLNLASGNKGSTTYNEVALANDIAAATAGAAAALLPVISSETNSIEIRLSTLDSLKEKGLIDGSEYTKRRDEILATI